MDQKAALSRRSWPGRPRQRYGSLIGRSPLLQNRGDLNSFVYGRTSPKFVCHHRDRRVWPHGVQFVRRAMPGWSLLSVFNLCLHVVKVSLIIELWIGGNPILETGLELIAMLIGWFIGFQFFCNIIDWPENFFCGPIQSGNQAASTRWTRRWRPSRTRRPT